MPTPIIQRELELFIEANELGANGSNVTAWNDLSGKGRNFAGTSAFPTVKTNAVNGKKSVLFNGSKNPLTLVSNFTIRCGFAVVKVAENFTDYNGFLSGLTGNAILEGSNGTGNWFERKAVASAPLSHHCH